MRWDRITDLLDKLKDELEKQGFTVCLFHWKNSS